MKCFAILLVLLLAQAAPAQKIEVIWSDQEKPIAEQVGKLRSLPDDVRATATRDLALQIRALAPAANKLVLALRLASRATEGDFGHDTLQEVTTTLESAIREQNPNKQDAYLELASLVRMSIDCATIFPSRL